MIVNPYAGGKKSAKLLPLIKKTLSVNNIDYHIHTSLYHGHILKITSGLKINNYDAIITLGGDGTNFHVLNGLLTHFKARQLPSLFNKWSVCISSQIKFNFKAGKSETQYWQTDSLQ